MLLSHNSPDDVVDGPLAWINGRFVPSQAAAVPVSDLGLHGLAVTEMVRTYDHNLFRLKDHLKRLRSSLAAVKIEADTEGLDEICRIIGMRNSSFVKSSTDIGLVIVVTAGPNPTYIGENSHGPTVCVHTFDLPLARWSHTIQDGVSLLVSNVPQLPAACLPPEAKTRSRLHWHLASMEVRAKNPAAQAILLNQSGQLTETPAANFFAAFGDSVVTPATDVLPGISRQVVSELCRVLGLQYEERPIRPDDMETADEAFISSTPYGLLPVTQFAERKIGNGLPGPIFFELCNAWSELVGIDIIEQITSSRS